MTTTKTKAQPQRCAACGAAGTVAQVARVRRVTHRGVALALPATLALSECSACHELWLDDEEADRYSAAVDAAYDAELRRRALEALGTLVEVSTQRRLETLLHLSHGYLSKLRTDDKAPSATLVGQLALLAMEPKKRVAELERFWSAKTVRAPKAKATRAPVHRRRAGA